MHNCNAFFIVEMGMGIDLAGLPMRGPARLGDGDIYGHFGSFDFLLKDRHFADFLAIDDFSVPDACNSRRVIAAVFQLFQAARSLFLRHF